GGRKVPFNILRMRSDDLLAQVFPTQVACQDNAGTGPIEPVDHPLVNETLRDCLHEAMDCEGLRALLHRIVGREVRLVARDLPEVVRGWVTCLGPFTASGLARRLRLPVSEVELAQLESEGLLLRGRFTAGAGELEWCERTLLARIHRLTLGRLRREIEPVAT